MKHIVTNVHPIAPRCMIEGHDHGVKATVVLCAPDGSRIDTKCEECARRIIEEYATKINEVWSTAPIYKTKAEVEALPNFKYGVYGVGETRMSFNACVFDTADEAKRAGHELQWRWTGMSSFDVVETDEPITYEFPMDTNRPVPCNR